VTRKPGETPDIEWILSEPVRITKTAYATYQVVELNGLRKLELTFLGTRLHFDGQDVETEDYYSYLAMTDAADQSPTGTAVFGD
jgi:hypothetical protein